jgi:hypothetical protein
MAFHPAAPLVCRMTGNASFPVPTSAWQIAARPEAGAEQENKICMSPRKTNYGQTDLVNGLKLTGLLMFFAWIVGSGKLNLHQVVRGLSQWPTMLAMLIFLCIQPCMTAWRWNLLLRARALQVDERGDYGKCLNC